MGNAEECSPGSWLAHATGKETTFPATPCLLQTLPYHGDQSQGNADLKFDALVQQLACRARNAAQGRISRDCLPALMEGEHMLPE